MRDAPAPTIRPLDPGSTAEVELVASRMRATLMEVVGAEEGRAMYSMEWLHARLRWHLEGEVEATVLVAEDAGGEVVGHTIVRVEADGDGPFGLYSTTYVAPEARRAGVARALVEAGEGWLRGRGMRRFATDTAQGNEKLIRLFQERGYRTVHETEDMLRLALELPPEA
ncbi:MAG: GNAT family N-acetyltransferase [Planctomycetota bacterium]|jgi:GNAT superfamily N-acetyltransferase